MKNRSSENGGGMPVANPLDQMVEGTHAARRDHPHANRVGDSVRQSDVETRFGSVAVHRGHQDLAGPVIDEPAGPFDRVDAGRPAGAMGEKLPPITARSLGGG